MINPRNKRAVERRAKRAMDERNFYENVDPKQKRPIQTKNRPSPSEALKYQGGDRRVQTINRDPKAPGLRAGVPTRRSSGLLASKAGLR